LVWTAACDTCKGIDSKGVVENILYINKSTSKNDTCLMIFSGFYNSPKCEPTNKCTQYCPTNTINYIDSFSIHNTSNNEIDNIDKVSNTWLSKICSKYAGIIGIFIGIIIFLAFIGLLYLLGVFY
jgi:hypothetical protein